MRDAVRAPGFVRDAVRAPGTVFPCLPFTSRMGAGWATLRRMATTPGAAEATRRDMVVRGYLVLVEPLTGA